MIQFNLLPDVKLEYIRARRTMRFVMLVASLITGFTLVIMIMLFMVANVFQRKHLSNLSNDITNFSNQLKSQPELNKVLTVQNQLGVLSGLHAQKPVGSRLTGYIQRLVPANISVAELEIDFVAHTMNFTGSADKLSDVNKFIDTLKFTTYEATAEGQEKKTANAFTGVVLTSFGRDKEGARYEVDLSYDPVIFDSVYEVKLVIPSIVTTRSALDKPDALFQAPVDEDEDNSGEGQ